MEKPEMIQIKQLYQQLLQGQKDIANGFKTQLKEMTKDIKEILQLSDDLGNEREGVHMGECDFGNAALKFEMEVSEVQMAGAWNQRDKGIILFEQFPSKIHYNTQNYYFSFKTLYLKGIMFKWMFPDGLVITWEGGRWRINKIERVVTFLENKTPLGFKSWRSWEKG